MSVKNALINPEWLNNCKEIVTQMSPEERAITLFACKQIEAKLDPLVRKELLKGTIDKFEFNYNGQTITMSISRGAETSKEVVEKVIDYDKAVEFAKEHNFNIPMTPRVVIEPQLDKEKLEMEEWFQNNCEEFITKKSTIKKSKSYDRIIIKEKK